MKIVPFGADVAEAIEGYESRSASSVALGDGTGEAHVYCLHIEPGGLIGRHPTGFGQLLLVVDGEGWAEGEDGLRVALRTGEAAYFAKGETHAKGSESGMTAVMVQVDSLKPRS